VLWRVPEVAATLARASIHLAVVSGRDSGEGVCNNLAGWGPVIENVNKSSTGSFRRNLPGGRRDFASMKSITCQLPRSTPPSSLPVYRYSASTGTPIIYSKFVSSCHCGGVPIPPIMAFFVSKRATTSVHASLNSPMSFEAALWTQWPLGLKTMALSKVNLTCSRRFEGSG
jgi:hypothetical protein